MSDDQLNTKKLDKLIRILQKKAKSVKVGIFGDNNPKYPDGLTTAQVGAFHEFGTSKMVRRSFLRMPLTEHFPKALEKSGAFGEGALKDIMESNNIDPWLELVAALAEATVQEAFSTGGFGQWAGWKGSYKSNTGDILVDTQQLRNSITAKIG